MGFVIKFSPLLGERVGGECCAKRVRCIGFVSAVEASADVFYVSLPHGDAVGCSMRKSYLGEKLGSFVCGGVGVMKRRQVGRYRGSAFTGRLREVDSVPPASGGSASSSWEGASSALSSSWCLCVCHRCYGRRGVGGRVCVVLL